MKVNVKLNVDAKSLYDVILNSLKEDIRVSTGKVATPYVGLEYMRDQKRHNNKVVDTVFRITSLDENELYAFDVISPVEITTVTYKINSISDNEIEIFYEERAHAESKRIGISHSLVSGLYGIAVGKRKMKKKFKAMENYIINSK
jgi:hypothetical protein